MKQRLSLIHRTWRRRLVTVVLTVLWLLSRLISRRSRCHWIGYYRRPRRFERHLIVLLFLAAMFLLEPREYALWSLTVGGGTSIFLVMMTVYHLLPRRRAHWIK